MSNSDTDMIGIESAEQMREKIKLKVKQEKEKGVRALYVKEIEAITTGNCKNYLDKLINTHSGGSSGLVGFEVEFHDKAVADLKKLLKMCFFSKYQSMSQIEVINEWFKDMENGGTSINTADEDSIVTEIKQCPTKVITASLKIYLNDIISRI